MTGAARHSRTRPEGGFTILEVLIALLLVAVGILGVGGLAVTNVRGNDAAGKMNACPELCARQVIANAPRIGRSSPVSASSPANSYRSSSSLGSWPDAARMPSAIGKSKRPLSLGKSAGARLTVIRRAGNSKRQLIRADRTRSRASLTSVSGKPTMVNAGRPAARWTSVVTNGASMPESARLYRTASDIAVRAFSLRWSR